MTVKAPSSAIASSGCEGKPAGTLDVVDACLMVGIGMLIRPQIDFVTLHSEMPAF